MTRATVCDSILLCSPCMILIFVFYFSSFLLFFPRCYFCHCMTQFLHRDQYNVISNLKHKYKVYRRSQTAKQKDSQVQTDG